MTHARSPIGGLRPWVLLGLLPLAAAASDAPQPTDFAWQWPLSIAPTEDALRIELTPEIYAQLARDDLRDLAAFNGADESLPLGPLPDSTPTDQPPTPANIELPMFRVPRPAQAGGESLRLLIERADDGRLRRIETAVDSAPAPAAGGDWLLDLSSVDSPLRGLLLVPAPEVADQLNARVEISGSRDLDRWQAIVPSQAVLSLREGELRLQRLSLPFTEGRWPYLRLRRIDADADLPLTAVLGLPAPPSATRDDRRQLDLQGVAVAGEPGVFDYRLPGPYPIDRVGVLPADRNALAAVTLVSRADADQPWRTRAQGAAFRLASGGEDVSADPFVLGAGRDRHWRLRSSPPLPRAPSLQFGYRQEAFLLLSQGGGPFRLVAGSTRTLRPEYPLASVLSALRAQHGRDWQPTALRPGDGSALSGDAARAVQPTPSRQQWLLWGLLTLAAAVIILLVLRLLRESAAR